MSKTFIKNFTITGLTNILFVLISLFNNILITRWIGPESRGTYALVSNIVIFINLLFGEGLRRSNTIIIGKDNSNFYKLFLINIIYFIFLLSLSFLFYLYKNLFSNLIPNISDSILWLTLLISVFLILWQGIQAIYLGLQKIVFFNVLFILSALLLLVFNAIGIYFFKIPLNGIFQNMLLTNIFVSIVGFWGFLKYKREKYFKNKFDVIKQLSLSIKSTIISLEIYTLQRSGIFFVNSFWGAAITGFFSIALTFSDLVQKIQVVAGTLIFSKISNENKKTNWENVAKVSRTVFFLHTVITLILILLGKTIILFLFGNEFSVAYVALKYMAPGLIFIGVAGVLHSYYMGIGYSKDMMMLNALITFFALISNYFLISYFSLVGAGISFSVIFVTWTVIYIYMFHKRTDISIYNLIFIKKDDINDILNFAKINLRLK